jgi:hypothetical protein
MNLIRQLKDVLVLGRKQKIRYIFEAKPCVNTKIQGFAWN